MIDLIRTKIKKKYYHWPQRKVKLQSSSRKLRNMLRMKKLSWTKANGNFSWTSLDVKILWECITYNVHISGYLCPFWGVRIRPCHNTTSVHDRENFDKVVPNFDPILRSKNFVLNRKIRRLQPLSPNDQIGPPGPARTLYCPNCQRTESTVRLPTVLF